MKNSNIFTRHPNEVRMTYLEHTMFALMLSRKTLTCAVASLIHAFFPFLFITHTSTTIKKIHDVFEKRQHKINQEEINNITLKANPNTIFDKKSLEINPERIEQQI
ncbi:MAG: DUF6356 family protein [Bacteroidota bacterium]